jgi:hypothetical protein
LLTPYWLPGPDPRREAARSETSSRWPAWVFYNSVQNKLNTTFTTPFVGLSVKLNSDGDPTQTYEAAGPWAITCKHRGKTGPGLIHLVYQVNGKGGVSYGCNKQCFDQEEEREEDQPRAEKSRKKSRGRTRLAQEGEEPGMEDPAIEPDQPEKQPGDQPQKKEPGEPVDEPGPQPTPVGDPTGVGDLLVAAAALTAAAALAKNAAKRKALEAAYKKVIVEVFERGAEETAKRLAINGVKLGSKALEKTFREDLEKALVKDLEKRAAKQAAKQGAKKLAGKVAAKAVPFLGVVLVATDALAMADHVSKGGTIKFGLAAGEADLSGSTEVKTKGDQPESSATSDAKLTDTKVDIETTGIPDLSGTSEIDAKNVTITGSIKGDGTRVAVSFKVKLENSTIVIKHGGIIRGDKMVLSGDVTIKDSQIEIDLPEGASAASPDNPVVISGRTLKITKTGGGGSASGPSPEAATPPTSDPKKVEPPATGLSEPVRARLEAAGPGVRDLIDAMVVPRQGRPGLRKDDAAVGAILDKLKDRKVTATELAELQAVHDPGRAVETARRER